MVLSLQGALAVLLLRLHLAPGALKVLVTLLFPGNQCGLCLQED